MICSCTGSEVALWRRGGSTEARWLYGGKLALRRQVGSTEARWLYGGDVAVWRRVAYEDKVALQRRDCFMEVR
jgi:hypothetical protein